MSASIADQLARIRSAFGHVIVDQPRGQKILGNRILGRRRQGNSDEADRLMSLFPEVVEVIATDDRESDAVFLKQLLLPGTPPVALFISDEHLQNSKVLLDRLNASMDCEVAVEWLYGPH